MKRWKSIYLVLIVCLLSCGCTTARRIGSATGKVALAAPLFLAAGLMNGLLDSDESDHQKIYKKEREDAWKQYWRANPNSNPRMAAAYSKDY